MKSTTLLLVVYVFMLIFVSHYVKDLEAVNEGCMRTESYTGLCPPRTGNILCEAEYNNSKEKPFRCYCRNQIGKRVCHCFFC
uniref:SCRp n=1 Tax=Arabidopsis halleri TaxID=81970 RepID=A0A0C5K894_ARAHA|nr:SCRp [Arabidopsis halleri]